VFQQGARRGLVFQQGARRGLVFQQGARRGLGKLRSWFPNKIYILGWLISLTMAGAQLMARGLIPSAEPLRRGFAPIPFVSLRNISQWAVSPEEKAPLLATFCGKMKTFFEKNQWKDVPCGTIPWQVEYKSKLGFPLIVTKFGKGRNVTLFLGGVHPDEKTPVPISFRLAQYLHDNPSLYVGKDIQIVIAPLVNPDGLLMGPITRSNGLVDVNRNFLTQDWYEKAHSSWAQRKKMRFFPGFFPHTEIETWFQVSLIESVAPSKILSIHAPLGFYDYDGPEEVLSRTPTRKDQAPKQFIYSVAKKSQDYPVENYTIYPGSLGNFAGYERNIPTITLELKSTDTTNQS